MTKIDEISDFELLMNTLPAMLATTTVLMSYILQKRVRHTAELYRVNPKRLETFALHMGPLAERRDRQRVSTNV